MRRTVIPLLLLAAPACVTPPQTVAEYRQLFKGGATPFGGTRQERTVDRPFQAVVADVRSNADRCFNVVTEHTRPSDVGIGQVRGSFRYRSQTRTTGAATAEMTVQMDVLAANPKPPGGYYMVLADLEAVSPSRTRVAVHGPDLSDWSDALASVLAWAGGQRRDCPKLP